MACKVRWLTSVIELFFPGVLTEFFRVTPISLTTLASQFKQYRPTMIQRTPQRGTVFQVCGSYMLKILSSGTKRTQHSLTQHQLIPGFLTCCLMLQQGFIASSYVGPLSQFLLWICKRDAYLWKAFTGIELSIFDGWSFSADNLHLASLRSRSFSALPDFHIISTPWCLSMQSPDHLKICLLALNLLLCSTQYAQAQRQMQFSIYCSPVFL